MTTSHFFLAYLGVALGNWRPIRQSVFLAVRAQSPERFDGLSYATRNEPHGGEVMASTLVGAALWPMTRIAWACQWLHGLRQRRWERS